MVVISASPVSAALPIFGGPTYNAPATTGYVDQNVHAAASSAVTLDGFAIGDGNRRTPTLFDAGERTLTWTPASQIVQNSLSAKADGYEASTPFAVNEGRTVVGTSNYYNGNTFLGSRAARWSPASPVPTQLGSLTPDTDGTVFSKALDVNEGGLTVGQSGKYNAGGTWIGNRAVKWGANTTTPIELPLTQFNYSATGFTSSSAHAVNDAGTIVGVAESYDNDKEFAGTRAMRWKSNNTFQTLNPLGYNPEFKTMCEAIDVNADGITVGVSNKYDYNNNQVHVGTRAVRWQADSISGQELGGLGGTAVDGTSHAQVSSISDGGLILGNSNKYVLGQQIGKRAVYWQATGSTAATELPNLGSNPDGITYGMARSANADDVIAGWVEQHSGGVNLGNRAVIWTTAGADKLINLNTLLAAGSGWTLQEAVGISDTGFVTGTGEYDPDGNGPAASYKRVFSMLVPQAGSYGRGDANFDTYVNFSDLVALAKNYDKPTNGSTTLGDFNLDGITNFTDLVTLAKHYNSGPADVDAFAASFAADWAMAQSLVPEPTAAAAVFGLAATLLRRRR